MHIQIDPDSTDLVRDQFALLRRVHDAAEIDLDAAIHEVKCNCLRDQLILEARDRIELVEFASRLLERRFRTVSELSVPRRN